MLTPQLAAEIEKSALEWAKKQNAIKETKETEQSSSNSKVDEASNKNS